MERAGRVLGKLKLAKQGVSDEEMAVSAWAAAVGAKIAIRTNPAGMVRTRLIVEVEDAVWQRQLWTLRDQILKRLEQVLGRVIVEELEFKIAVPRIRPARTEISHTVSNDEADQILDPTFRSFYKAARKRANA
jgi:predicted nucleic acid-binding Zn ribbon protein